MSGPPADLGLLDALAGVGAESLASRREPITLDERSPIVVVVAGGLDVFYEPVAGGTRFPGARVDPGELLVGAGIDELPGRMVALADPDTIVRTLDLEMLLAASPSLLDAALGRWLHALGDEAPPVPEGWTANALRRANHSAIGSLIARRADDHENEWARRARRQAHEQEQVGRTLRLAAETLSDRSGSSAVAAPEDELLAAVAACGEVLGVKVVAPPGGVDPTLESITAASGLRARRVALEDGWTREASVPLVAFLPDGDSSRPVALLPAGERSYDLLDSRAGVRAPLDEETAQQMVPIARQLYRPFPAGALRGRALLAFALQGSRRDIAVALTIALVVGLLGLLVPVLFNVAFSSAIPGGERAELIEIAAGLVLAAFAAMALTVVQGLAVARIAGRADRIAGSALWDRLIALPASFFRRYDAGGLAARAGGIEQIRQLLATTVATSVFALIASVCNVVLLFTYSVGLALVALGLLVVLAGVTFASALLQARNVRALVDIDNRIQGSLVQTVTGVAKLRVAGAERRIFARLLEASIQRQRRAMRQQRIGNGVQAFNAAANALVLATLFAVIIETSWGSVDAPTFLAFSVAYGVVTAALIQVSNQLVLIAPVVPLYEQIRPILDAEPEIDRAGDAPGRLTGQVEVRGVSFRYGKGAPLVLDDVTLTVAPGEFVALVGASGSGKSTLVRLLLGFEQPAQGAIFFDAHDLARLDVRAVRRQLGVVLQNSRLVPGTIAANVVPTEVDRGVEDVAWAALAAAGVEQDVRAMPMGVQTMVSAIGGLSGGQAQRLIIARALATSPRLIIFDEATSALDNASQAAVTSTLRELDATRIVIAHRLSTIRSADRIVVLERGRVVEQGTYAALMTAGGPFASIAARQLV